MAHGYVYGNTSGTEVDAFLSTTLQHYCDSGALHDNIAKQTPLLDALRGGMEGVSGGTHFVTGVRHGLNDTVASYSRLETLNINTQDNSTQATFNPCQYAVSISLDGLKIVQNSGSKEKLVDLLKQETMDAEAAAGEDMNEDLLDIANVTISTATTGNSGKNIIGLPLIVQSDPTTTSTLGSIDQSSNSYWRNQYTDSAATTYASFIKEIRHLFNLCTKGTGGKPNMGLCDMLTHELIVAALDEKVRYTSTDKASPGFGSVNYLGCDIFWDEMVPDIKNSYNWDSSSWAKGTLYFINKDKLKLYYYKGRDFDPTPFVKPADQDGKTSNLLWAGQLVPKQRRKHGVLFDIDTSIAS